MNLLDPQRKLIAGRPALLEGPLGVVPGLRVFPASHLTVSVEVMLQISPNLAESFQLSLLTSDLPALIADYFENPEQVLRERFGWKVVTPTQTSPTTLTLKDLGL